MGKKCKHTREKEHEHEDEQTTQRGRERKEGRGIPSVESCHYLLVVVEAVRFRVKYFAALALGVKTTGLYRWILCGYILEVGHKLSFSYRLSSK
jgi:hypothetical protein